jgi:hypothetical protein
MPKNKSFIGSLTVLLLLGCGALRAGESAGTLAETSLRIDIPVRLENANVVLNIDHLALVGDMPIAIGHLNLLSADFREVNKRPYHRAFSHERGTRHLE